MPIEKPSPSTKNKKSFEETLWDTANKLRGSNSSNTKGKGEIRQMLVENDLVDCVESQVYPLVA